jgi:hypothetical protein
LYRTFGLSWVGGRGFGFFLPHPFVFIGSFLLSWGKVPFNWRIEVLGFIGYGFGLVGACVGGWIGSMLRRRFSSGHVSGSEQKLSSTH